MKVIFLDIDGVLNSDPFLKDQHDIGSFEDVDHIDPSRINILNKLIHETGASIVISSAWRLQFKFDNLALFLNKLGINGAIIDRTIDFKNIRDLEISKWIADNKPSNIVILEDCHDMNDLLPFTVMTDPDVGLSEEDVISAIAILNKEAPTILNSDLENLFSAFE